MFGSIRRWLDRAKAARAAQERFWKAVWRNDLVAIEQAIMDGANVHGLCASNQPTPAIYEAADHGLNDMIKVLVRHGASPNDRGEDGETCLMAAGRRGYVGTMALLLQNGADPSAVDAKGRTVEDVLRAWQPEEVVRQALAVLRAHRESGTGGPPASSG